MTYTIDVQHVIRQLGGVTQLARDLNENFDNEITPKGIQKWRQRGSIPMNRWLQLLSLAEKKGVTLQPTRGTHQ